MNKRTAALILIKAVCVISFALYAAMAQSPTYIYPKLCALECGLAHHTHEYINEDTVLFHFENWVFNVGDGPLHLGAYVVVDGADTTVFARQRIYADDSLSTIDTTIGELHWEAADHNHYHFEDFLHYRLVRYSDDSEMISLPKGGFCFRDDYSGTFAHLDTCGCDSPTGDPSAAVYELGSCAYDPDSLFMGISVGWADAYNYPL